MRALLAVAAAAMLAAPAEAAVAPGDRATVDVAVATLWKAPNSHRPLDLPSTTNPVDPVAWSRNLATTDLRVWLDSHVQTQALYGQQVVVLARSGAWAKVAVVDEPDPQDPRGYPGWLPVAQLRPGALEGVRFVVASARTTDVVIGTRALAVSYGTRLPLVRRSGDAAVVRTPDGEGTVAGGEWWEPNRPTGAQVVAQAKRFLGVRYLWGGLSAWGFDCSGLVWDVYRAFGVTIPRDADPQFRHGRPVAPNALRPGDLLFYGTQSYVHHVAIYAGRGLMVEAPDSAHRVREVPVRWGEFAGARRY